MYILKITNTHADRDDLFIYEDIDFASVVRSFTTEALESIVKIILNQDGLPLNDKTFRKCAHVIGFVTEDQFAEGNVWEFLQRVYTAPDDIPDEVEELDFWSKQDSFHSTGEIFLENGISETFGQFTIHTNWVIYDNNTYGYELFFQAGNGHIIDIDLIYKDGFDTPPSKLSLTI